MMKTTLSLFTLVALLAAPVLALAAGKARPLTIPDFTKGEAIPAGAKHDWNLGPTGLRGWIFCDQMVTTDARQIAITRVEKGSPADGILAVGDVILGVGGKPVCQGDNTLARRLVEAVRREGIGHGTDLNKCLVR